MVLYNRIINQGTINAPKGNSNPQFSLPATVNWMHALRILIEDAKVDFHTAAYFYASKGNRCGKRNMDTLVENTVLEQLFLGLHNLSALEQLRKGANLADFARIGILAWYFGIANAASAMTVAQSDDFKEDHAGTANSWDKQIACRGLVMEPFNWRVSSLVEKTYKPEIAAYKKGSTGKLLPKPKSKTEALGAMAEYLSGSADWYAKRAEKDIKKSPEFKELEVSDFRKKEARTLRDKQLSEKSIGFVHQASRYRGKANYREVLFLAYGRNTKSQLADFVVDLSIVLRAFLAMAGAFSKRKLGQKLWADFLADVDAKRAFTIRATDVWC